jgi:hypothetical protein
MQTIKIIERFPFDLAKGRFRLAIGETRFPCDLPAVCLVNYRQDNAFWYFSTTWKKNAATGWPLIDIVHSNKE